MNVVNWRSARSAIPIGLCLVSMLALGGMTPAQSPSPSPSPAGLPVTAERLLNAAKEPGNWLTYSGDYKSHHYSSLNQITADNVHRLRAKWIYQMHRHESRNDADRGGWRDVRDASAERCDRARRRDRPSTVDIRAQAGGPRLRLLRRGQSRPGDPRHGTLFLTTLDAQLVALDARAGRVLWKKVIADPALNYTATGAPLAIKDKVIVGIGGAEGGIRGFLDAYDAKTGERRMAFLDGACAR